MLRKDSTIDGLKTGFIAEAGYHLLATAKRDERRLIAVVMGAKNRAIRAEEALKLLNYGYRNFAFVSLFTKGQVLYDLPVWKGQRNDLHIVPGEEGMIVVPADQKNKLEHERFLPGYVVAPIEKNQVIGKYVVKMGTIVIRSIPLVAETDVPKAGFVKLMVHSALYFLGRIKVVTYVVLPVIVILALVLLILYVFGLKLGWFPFQHAYDNGAIPGWNWHFISSAVNHGILPAATYRPVVEKAWTGMVTKAVQSSGLLGFCQGTGQRPSDGQPVKATSVTAVGVGAFLLAGSQLTRLEA